MTHNYYIVIPGPQDNTGESSGPQLMEHYEEIPGASRTSPRDHISVSPHNSQSRKAKSPYAAQRRKVDLTRLLD